MKGTIFMHSKNIEEILNHRKNMHLKLVVQGILIGLITGLVIVLNRILISKFFTVFEDFYIKSRDNIYETIIVFITVSFFGLITGYMVKRESMISGSGIPQVKGRVINKISVNWFKILVYKFLGGLISLSVGLSVGREGPSVQMGASIGEGLANKFVEKLHAKEEFLITAGASAGLSAAFNSPLAGIIFALEEVHRTFSPLVLLPAMAASLTADFISKNFLGMESALNFNILTPLPLHLYWLLVILGIVTGVFGVIFCKGIYLFQNLYGKFKSIPIQFKVMFPFMITAIAGIISPILLGGGHEIIVHLANANNSISQLSILYIIKFLLLLICFGSGVPGGIFLPMLLLGALLGKIFGDISVTYLGINSIYVLNFITLAMASYFVAVVKAPITGIILIMEMTGSFSNLLSIAVVVIIAYLTSDILRNEPIYEKLLERFLNNVGAANHLDKHDKTLMEFVIEMDSTVEDKLIKDISWPKDCLLVAIKRGDSEIIPRGNVKLIAGDYIIVLVDDHKTSEIYEQITSITLAD